MKQYIITLLTIFVVVIIYYSYVLGKIKQENKQYKKNNKLQKKINKINKTKNKKELMNILKRGKFIFLLFLVSCISYSNVYIPLQQYTEQEQKELAIFLEKNNNDIVDKVILDYWRLRIIIETINK